MDKYDDIYNDMMFIMMGDVYNDFDVIMILIMIMYVYNDMYNKQLIYVY